MRVRLRVEIDGEFTDDDEAERFCDDLAEELEWAMASFVESRPGVSFDLTYI